jgi:hypothetical protein
MYLFEKYSSKCAKKYSKKYINNNIYASLSHINKKSFVSKFIANNHKINNPMMWTKKDTYISQCKRYDSTLNRIKLMCHRYISDPECVYKMCTEDITAKQWLVIMKKRPDSKTNENRKNIFDPFHAKYRADKLYVLKIINVNNIEETVDSIFHKHLTFGYNAIYTVGSIVESDNYDKDIREICTNGIHYYKSFESAYFNRPIPDNYTGRWVFQNSDGSKYWEEVCENGVFKFQCNCNKVLRTFILNG